MPAHRCGRGQRSGEELTQEEIDAVFAEVARSLKRAHDGVKVGRRGLGELGNDVLLIVLSPFRSFSLSLSLSYYALSCFEWGGVK